MWGRWRRAERFAAEHEQTLRDAPDRGIRSLARDALVVAIDPVSGKVWNGGRYVVPTALLLELVHEGRLEVSGTGKKARATVCDPRPLGNHELDEALIAIGTGLGGSKVTTLLTDVPQTAQLLQELVADGVVRKESHRLLGLFTVRRHRPTPLARRDELVAQLRAALVDGSVPDDRTALLVSALVGVHPKVYVERGEVRQAYRSLPAVSERAGDSERAVASAARAALSDSISR